MESLEALDLGAMYYVGSLQREWVQDVAAAVTRLGNFVVLGPLALLAVVAFVLLRQRRYAVGLAIVCLSGLAVEWSAKLLVNRPRPQVAWRQRIALPNQPSFPSGHALNSMAIYTTALVLFGRLYRRRWLGVVGVAFGLAIGLTRPVLGVHYPLDVLAGWTAGLGVALVGVHLIGEPAPRPPPPATGTPAARPAS